jgi:hypothetical protein
MKSLRADSVDPLRLPTLLTVEEAGALLRIGRTKAYAMAREWRETDGRTGLPVIDLGHVLRVPRRALEEMVGVELVDEIHATSEPSTGSESGRQVKRSRLTRTSDQLGLFETIVD